jgi:hypothetical protein
MIEKSCQHVLVLAPLLGAIAALFALGSEALSAEESSAARRPSAAGSIVVATVNGEPIYSSELSPLNPAAPPDKGLPPVLQGKLERLIEARAIHQFLSGHKLFASESEIDAGVQWLKENPPSAGCPCCLYAGGLAGYLAANSMDMKELREKLGNNIGLKVYLSSLWEKQYPAGEKRDAFVRGEKTRICKEYVKASHILFKTVYAAATLTGPVVPKDKKAEAVAAWQKLKQGASFEAVARERSEDDMTRSEGGELGCIPVSAFGMEFEEAVTALAPGAYSRPIESMYGFHIIRRETMSDEDIAQVAKEEYMQSKEDEVLQAIEDGAVITRVDTKQ